MASAVASTSTARTVASGATRRINRRTARSTQQHAVASLCELYHLAPTFVPAQDPNALARRVTETLAPIDYEGARPRVSDFRDLVHLNRRLDLEKVRLTAARTVTSSLQSVDTTSPANFNHEQYFDFSQGPGKQFDYRASFYQAYNQAGEPPLAQRLRKVVDALHGTTAGGRAGPQVVAEHGEKAVQWNRELEQAQNAARDQRRRDEDESRAFQEAFEDESQARS
ncbi:hypothetical protein JCM10908_005582 [Rhodotorula pacifica]|uniref:uncharacterized protein n=1 Tax=Rhodotorula pacifica TaxID=1495444 RepID=UPI0031733E41